MSEQAVAEENSAPDEEEELERDAASDESGTEGASTEPSATSWAVRGAIVGAVAGSAAGAGIGMVVARRPELLEQAKDAIRGSGRQVARAAGVAAVEVVASGRLNQLLSGNGNGDRAQVVKDTAKEAGAAAARAARDSIISLRRDAISSR